MNNCIQRLESHVSLSTNTSNLLEKQVKHLQKQLLACQQYSRRDCIDICGIDKGIKDEDLESEVCEIFSEINIHLDEENDRQAYLIFRICF